MEERLAAELAADVCVEVRGTEVMACCGLEGRLANGECGRGISDELAIGGVGEEVAVDVILYPAQWPDDRFGGRARELGESAR